MVWLNTKLKQSRLITSESACFQFWLHPVLDERWFCQQQAFWVRSQGWTFWTDWPWVSPLLRALARLVIVISPFSDQKWCCPPQLCRQNWPSRRRDCHETGARAQVRWWGRRAGHSGAGNLLGISRRDFVMEKYVFLLTKLGWETSLSPVYCSVLSLGRFDWRTGRL